MKSLTLADAEHFWEYLDKEHLHISIQLPSKAFVNDVIVSFQPARMKNEDYAEYQRILKQWLTDNGFM